jgi:beta-barrel assembly-enhancing protease
MPKNPLLLVAVFALTTASAFGQTTEIDLPQLGNPADLALSPAQENRLGAEVVSELYQYDYIVDDPEVTEYLTEVGWRLASSDPSTPNPPAFNFYLVADNRINAFALPGGFVCFNAGTVVAAANESELAGVMAHEESHVTQRHMARAAGDTNVANIATWLVALAAIIAGSANPDVVLGALSVAQGINYQRQVSYTRGDEMEADRFGIRKLAAAGYDPMGMATFFDRLQQETRLYGSRVPEILQDHPVNTTRIAEATERAAQYGPRHVKDSIEFLLMRGRTRVLETDSPLEALGYFTGEINQGHDTPENRYGYAMSLANLSRYDEALKAMAPLVEQYPKQPNVAMLQAEILIGAGKTKDGMDLYARTLNNFPRYAPVILKYAQALIDNSQPELARQVLINHPQALGTRIDTYKLLSDAARGAGHTAEAQYQAANYLVARGDLRGAIEQLNAGLRVASISDDDRARLAAKRKELIDTIPKEQLKEMQRG